MKVSSLHRWIAKDGGGHEGLSLMPDVRSASPFSLWSGCCHYTKHFQPSANVFNQSLRFDFLFRCLCEDCWGVWRQFKAIQTTRWQSERETFSERWTGQKNRATKGLKQQLCDNNYGWRRCPFMTLLPSICLWCMSALFNFHSFIRLCQTDKYILLLKLRMMYLAVRCSLLLVELTNWQRNNMDHDKEIRKPRILCWGNAHHQWHRRKFLELWVDLWESMLMLQLRHWAAIRDRISPVCFLSLSSFNVSDETFGP